ncbi:MAG: hypothetical protein VKI93_02065 [Synechococcus sp.]|nr:hypothetical protein [Synechococcus sp.]
MTASCFNRVPLRIRITAMRSVVAFTVLAAALTIAPEDPRSQASICQRHHSQEACRVW